MSAVMRDVDRRTNALMLTDHVAALERYGKLVEDLGVSQTPSVVIIDRSGEARLIEGYVDSDGLAQAVADARDDRRASRVRAARRTRRPGRD